MVIAQNFKEKVPKGFVAVNVTSNSKTWAKACSPFFLGTVKTSTGVAKNVENAWQFSKVYKELGHWDKKNKCPSKKWIKWKNKGFSDTYAHRYPAGKGAIPIGSWHEDTLLPYVKARKKMYIPWYRKLYMSEDLHYIMYEFCNKHKNVVIQDYDVQNHINLGVTLKYLKNHPKFKYGHGFVILECIYDQLRTDNLPFG